MRRLRAPHLVVCLALWLNACACHPVADQNLWNMSSRGGVVLLIAAASAAHIEPEETAASANRCPERDSLSETGRAQARRLKHALQSQKVTAGRVLSGSDCRSVVTAGIVFGRTEPWSILDETSGNGSRMRQDKLGALREAIARWNSENNLALVTLRSNIHEALGIDLLPGDVVVIEPMGDAGYRLLGKLPAN